MAGKLNAIRTVKLTGDIPQNVDFAIKGAVARSFLDIHGVDYRRRLSDETLAPEAVAALAHDSRLRCSAGSSRGVRLKLFSEPSRPRSLALSRFFVSLSLCA